MKWAEINSALRSRWIDGEFLPTIYATTEGIPEGGQPYARFWFMPSVTAPETAGMSGYDLAEGFAQIDLMYPVGEGAGDALGMAGQVARHFRAGVRLVYEGQDVIIRGTSVAPPMNDDGWLMVPVTVNWSAFMTRADDAPPAPVCTITLTDSIATTAGAYPLTIDGQTVSYIADDDYANGLASQPLAQAYPIDWAGERVFGMLISTAPATASTGIALVKSDLSKIAQISYNSLSSEWESSAEGLPAAPETAGASTLFGSIGIDGATGDVTWYVNGTPVRSVSAYFNPATDNVVIAAVGNSLVNGESAEWTVVTNGADFQATYTDPALRDWCGQDTVPVISGALVTSDGDFFITSDGEQVIVP